MLSLGINSVAPHLTEMFKFNAVRFNEVWFNHVSVKIYCFQVSAAVNYNLIYDSSSSVNLERCLTLEQHE